MDKRMMSYLPPFWHDNEELKRIFKAQGMEIEAIASLSDEILRDAFLLTMGEKRIEEWEKWLNLPVSGTLEERRLRIMQYFGVIAKLNEGAIKTLVARLHNGARAIVRLRNSNIEITVVPLPENFTDELDFTDLYNQLYARKPCHLGLSIERQFSTWGDINDGLTSWAHVGSYKNWEEILMYIKE